MIYQVQMYYKDDKQLNVDVLKDEIVKFWDDLNKSQVYIHPVTKVGFWTNILDIRYIRIYRKEEDDEIIQDPDESSEFVPSGDEDSEGGTTTPE